MSHSSQWRVAGLSYLKYVEISSNALRKCLKNPDPKVLQRGEIHFQERTWTDGVQGEKILVQDSMTATPMLEKPTHK